MTLATVTRPQLAGTGSNVGAAVAIVAIGLLAVYGLTRQVAPVKAPNRRQRHRRNVEHVERLYRLAR